MTMKKRRRSAPGDAPAAKAFDLGASYLPEPLMLFGNGGLHVDPKAGIARYGPCSLGTARHPTHLRVGFIGTAATIELATHWLLANADGVEGTETTPRFPGYRADRGFCADIQVAPQWNELLTQTEVKGVLADNMRRGDRFNHAVDLIEAKLRAMSEKDLPPQYVVLALPEPMVRKCGTADYTDPERGLVHRDLRRAIKARAMKYRLPTQLVRESTLEGRDSTPRARMAWNFMTGLYAKAGGVPWGPRGLAYDTCYVGIAFYRPLGTKRPLLQTSLAQAFDENGEGLVLRGHEFEWDARSEGTKSPHLTEVQSHDLIKTALERYIREMKRPPRRVVVHKRSRFRDEERRGFAAGLEGKVQTFDFVSVAKQSDVRLFPMNRYPTLRGTHFSIANTDFLYTTGFIADLQEFHGMHVPTPLQITDHINQDTSRADLLREMMILTKMNWNSAGMAGLMPISVRFSALVGDILREVPQNMEPLPQFKYYM